MVYETFKSFVDLKEAFYRTWLFNVKIILNEKEISTHLVTIIIDIYEWIQIEYTGRFAQLNYVQSNIEQTIRQDKKLVRCGTQNNKIKIICYADDTILIRGHWWQPTKTISSNSNKSNNIQCNSINEQKKVHVNIQETDQIQLRNRKVYGIWQLKKNLVYQRDIECKRKTIVTTVLSYTTVSRGESIGKSTNTHNRNGPLVAITDRTRR